MSIKEIEAEIEKIEAEIERYDYYIQRIHQNMLGELLASYGGRTTGHSADDVFLQECIKMKEILTIKLKFLREHLHEDKG